MNGCITSKLGINNENIFPIESINVNYVNIYHIPYKKSDRFKDKIF